MLRKLLLMRILIADDDLMLAKTLGNMVEKCGHEVSGFAFDGAGVIRDYEDQRPDVVLMDYSMSQIDGANASRKILSQFPTAKIIMLSGYLTTEALLHLECGAFMKEPKPIEMERLREILIQVNPDETD